METPTPAPATLQVAMKPSTADVKEKAYERLLNDLELRAVALYRMKALESLALQIELLGGGSGRGRSGVTARAASKPRKLAWDIVNKLVWKRLAKRSSSGGSGGHGLRLSEDPVLPPHIDIESLTSRLRDTFPKAVISDEDIAKLERDFGSRAAGLQKYAEGQRREWWQQVQRGKGINDRTLGVSLRAHPKDSELFQLQWSDQGMVVETIELWKTHVNALRSLHRTQRKKAASPGSLDDKLEAGVELARIFTMVLRYDSLSGCKCAYQAALPHSVMELLRQELKCAHECFASPLNQYLGSFCSAFADTDAAFGSHGSFFDFFPAEGSFECNPPFDAQSMHRCLEHVHRLLRTSDRPLTFVVTVPTLDGTFSDVEGSAFRALDDGGYRSTAVEVRGKDHSYLMGLQHRRQADGVYWRSELASTAYVYQNASGRLQWPVPATFADQLRRAWKC